MPKHHGDVLAFIAVAQERSFTKAAAKSGLSASALSHTIRRLETRLGVRLLMRTTRSVSPTEAGEQLLQRITPHFEAIDAELAALGELRKKPSGTIRITTSAHAADTILWPVIVKLVSRCPDIRIELDIDSAFVDIVANRFDAGVRLGEALAPGMIAMRIGPDQQLAAVASPAYFSKRSIPKVPRDLADHRCINLRFPTHGQLYAWEFEKAGREVKVRVEGPLVFNSVPHAVAAALAGLGIAYVPEELVRPHLTRRRLVHVLQDWSPPYPGYHLYYPSRRQHSAAFQLLLDALRLKNGNVPPSSV